MTFNAVGPLAFAPVLFSAHDGSFDAFDTGSAASNELETLAEVGNPTTLRALIPTTADSAASTGPTAVGGSFTVTMTISDANKYFSYVGMVLPSSDAFVGNNNPTAFDLSGLLDPSNTTPVVLDVSRIYDAGTEDNDFTNAPGGPLVGLPAGVATDGIDTPGGVITLATGDHFSTTYAGAPAAFDLTTIDPNGGNVATITITPIP